MIRLVGERLPTVADQIDEVADQGVVLEQPHLSKIAKYYAANQQRCTKHAQLHRQDEKKADGKLRGSKRKEEYPFGT